MGYGTNPEIVEQRRDLVSELEAGHPQSWTCDPDPQSTRRFAFQIRETLKIAARYPLRFPELAEAEKNFAICEVADGLVEARWKGKTGTATAPDIPTHGLEPQGKLVPSVSLDSADQIIQAWKDHLPSSDPLHFVKTKLDVSELTRLYNWAMSWVPRLMMLVDEANSTMTLSLLDPTVKEFMWSPAPPPKPPERKLDL